MSVYEKLDGLKITLPKMTAPWAAYVPQVRGGKMVFLAGHVCFHRHPGRTQPVNKGDMIEVELEGVGVLHNTIAVAGRSN